MENRTVTGPDYLISKMSILYETITSCTSPFVQYAAIEAMKNSNNQTYSMVAKYQERRDLIVNGLNNIKGINCFKPEGTFYVFVNIKEIMSSSEEFSNQLLNTQYVATCPGIYFGSKGEGYIRLCFANSIDNIDIGISRIKAFVESI